MLLFKNEHCSFFQLVLFHNILDDPFDCKIKLYNNYKKMLNDNYNKIEFNPYRNTALHIGTNHSAKPQF